MPGPSNKSNKKRANRLAAAKKKKEEDEAFRVAIESLALLQLQEPPQRSNETESEVRGEEEDPPRGRRVTRRTNASLQATSSTHDPGSSIPQPLLLQQPAIASRAAPDWSTNSLNEPPCLTDPGNGIRVTDPYAFMLSTVSDPPSDTDPDCLDFQSPEVYQILERLLPQDLALILWYNKTRETGRICPACRRVYHIGDKLLPHKDQPQPQPQNSSRESETFKKDEEDAMRLRREMEQRISGLCDWLCFGIAAYRWPGCIEAYGQLSISISEELIQYMNTLGDPNVKDDLGMGQLIRMTRNDDLGIEEWRCGILDGVIDITAIK